MNIWHWVGMISLALIVLYLAYKFRIFRVILDGIVDIFD